MLRDPLRLKFLPRPHKTAERSPSTETNHLLGGGVQRTIIDLGNGGKRSPGVHALVSGHWVPSRREILRLTPPGNGYSPGSCGRSTSVGIRKIGYFVSCTRQMIGVKAKIPPQGTISRDEGMQSFRTVGFVQRFRSQCETPIPIVNNHVAPRGRNDHIWQFV
jgi:hypothetical protein